MPVTGLEAGFRLCAGSGGGLVNAMVLGSVLSTCRSADEARGVPVTLCARRGTGCKACQLPCHGLKRKFARLEDHQGRCSILFSCSLIIYSNQELPMPSGIQWDPVVQQELAMRGVDKATGVYGNHKVQIGKGSPLRLDEIKSASMPYAGFTQVKKIERGKAGIAEGSQNVLKTLCNRSGTLDAKSLLGSLKAMQTQTDRLAALGQLTPAQKQDTMWT
ncbi:MAG: hypothetical protein J6P53_00175, partial [Mailhella sp.]|nr:hypothetical protein [Mailhella sp.]